jgi:Ran GTPase-activating protein (RanGAP) involved in mRNA processing and transport
MSFFDDSLQGINPGALRLSIEQMRADVKQEVADEFYSKEEGEFIQAAIDNLSDELNGVTSFEKLKIKEKARIIAFMSFIYDVLEQDDEFEDDDFDDLDDEDGDDEEDDDDDGEDNGTGDSTKPSKKNNKKVESFPR